MAEANSSQIRLHEDESLFREAIDFTAADTTFPPRLIEKDYFCTVLLEYLNPIEQLVFKGGTCLAKVHTNFYRLSEDLDFVIPLPVDSNRPERRQAIAPVKEAFAQLVKQLPIFRENQPLTGARFSTQYIAILEYNSLLADNVEKIKVEISLREPLLEKVSVMDAATILLNPVSKKAIVPSLQVATISKREAYSEKFRAAMTRRDPAIRDYFDLDYAVTQTGLKPDEKELVALVRQKLEVPGNDMQKLNDGRLGALKQQVDAELKPVLKQGDFEQFDLERAINIVKEMHSRL